MAFSPTEVLSMLLFLLAAASRITAETKCIFQGEENSDGFYEEGDVVFGGLFPLHSNQISASQFFKKRPQTPSYKFFSVTALQWMQTMAFAVWEINQRKDLLPFLKLGYHIRDSCDDIPASLRSSLILVNGQPEQNPNSSCAGLRRPGSPVLIGDASSGATMSLLRTLGSFQIPMVSYFASCNCLSNRKEFPTFMRTMPSDAFQIKAITKLIRHFNWTWVGLIGADSDYARSAVKLFLEESARIGVCAAYVHFYPQSMSKDSVIKLINTIKISSAQVILSFSGESELHTILREWKHQNVSRMQWIAGEAWSTGSSLWNDFHDVLIGTLGFGIRRAEIPGLKYFLTRFKSSDAIGSTLLSEFWEQTFDCKLNGSLNTHVHGNLNATLSRKQCTGLENLEEVHSVYTDVSQLRVSYNVYKAVYLIAHALHNLKTCVKGNGPFANGECADSKHFLPWQVGFLCDSCTAIYVGKEYSTPFPHKY